MALLRQLSLLAIYFTLWIFLLGVTVPTAWGAESIKVVTTTSDLKSLVQVVGRERVEVSSIALPAQDPHTFEPRLANLQQLKDAKLAVKIGLDHDLWFDRLLQQTNNPNLQRGGKGYVDASTGIPLLEVRSTTLAPTSGHTHGAGNPHYWLDPNNAETITGAIMEGLSRIDSEHAQFYQANRAAFLAELETKVTDWGKQLAPYQGLPIIAYHNSWPYLARRFRLNVIDYIEPKPGVPASPTHLTSLIREMKEQHVSLVVKEPYESEQIPQLLRRKTGAKVVTLISSVGAIPEVQDYFCLFDYNINALTQGFGSTN